MSYVAVVTRARQRRAFEHTVFMNDFFVSLLSTVSFGSVTVWGIVSGYSDNSTRKKDGRCNGRQPARNCASPFYACTCSNFVSLVINTLSTYCNVKRIALALNHCMLPVSCACAARCIRSELQQQQLEEASATIEQLRNSISVLEAENEALKSNLISMETVSSRVPVLVVVSVSVAARSG